MTRGRILFALVSVALVVAIASGSLAGALTGADEGDDSLYKNLSIFTEVLNLIRRTYVEETAVELLVAGAVDGSTEALDQMATYVPSEHLERYRAAREVGTAHSGVAVIKERGITYALTVIAGSPAAEAELERGDILAEIDGRSTRLMPLWEIQTLLAGPPGTELELEVIRSGQTLDVRLTLGRFEVLPPTIERREGLPVLRLTELGSGVPEQVEPMLTSLAATDENRLMLDLRGVAGGSAEAAFRMASLFAEGDLGELRDREGVIERFRGDREPVWRGQLVVLTDRGSQGASEILATVLRQAAGAELVGGRTFGHAGREASVTLSAGELFLTDAFYAGPDGSPIDTGLEPEVLVTEASRNLSEADVPLGDLILERGLERLRAMEPELEQVA